MPLEDKNFLRCGIASKMVDVRAVFKALDGKHDIVLFGADEHLRICVKNGSLVDCLQRLAEVHESLEKLLNF